MERHGLWVIGYVIQYFYLQLTKQLLNTLLLHYWLNSNIPQYRFLQLEERADKLQTALTHRANISSLLNYPLNTIDNKKKHDSISVCSFKATKYRNLIFLEPLGLSIFVHNL
jgi:hypothetical protein